MAAKQDRRRGVLLVSLIVALAVAAALGAGMATLFGTSSRGTLQSGRGLRAYYLAESGGQYALSRARASPGLKVSGTFRLQGDGGQFLLRSYNDRRTKNRIVVESTGTFADMRRMLTFNYPKYLSGGGTWDGSGDVVVGRTFLIPGPDADSYTTYTADGKKPLKFGKHGIPKGKWSYVREGVAVVNAADYLLRAWDYAGGYLSYDVQVKTSVDFKTPDESHFGGIDLRLTPEGRRYGVAFAKSAKSGKDGIPTDLLPDECKHWEHGVCTATRDLDEPMVVIWQDIGDGAGDKRWLAYRQLTKASGMLRRDRNAPLEWSTLLVQIREAPSISVSGLSAAINPGALLTQANGAEARAASVLLSRGGSPAEGAVMLTSVAADFAPGPLFVNGAPAGDVTEFLIKDNFIWVFMGDPASRTPNANPYDYSRAGYARGQYNTWPPDDLAAWNASVDYFTLVSWELSNTDSPVTHEILGPVGHPDTVIRTHALTSPDELPGPGPEVGLHTFGWDEFDREEAGMKFSKKYYFDDFGLRTEVFVPGGSGYQY